MITRYFVIGFCSFSLFFLFGNCGDGEPQLDGGLGDSAVTSVDNHQPDGAPSMPYDPAPYHPPRTGFVRLPDDAIPREPTPFETIPRPEPEPNPCPVCNKKKIYNGLQ